MNNDSNEMPLAARLMKRPASNTNPSYFSNRPSPDLCRQSAQLLD